MFDNSSDKKTFEALISEKIKYLRQLSESLSENDPSVTLRTLWYMEQESSVLREIIVKTYIEDTSAYKTDKDH